jgi:hypothetical protein
MIVSQRMANPTTATTAPAVRARDLRAAFGEVAELRWREVDLKNLRLRIAR